MSLVKNGLLVYPLQQSRVQRGGQVVYDRATRGKSWFILDLVVPGGRFLPAGSSGLVTADNKDFLSGSRHKENA